MEVSKNKTDAITGLPLYDSFLEIAQTEIDNNPSKMLVLISTDIANFKYVNKIYGYNKANELINELISVIQDDNQEIVCACRTHSDHIISLFRYNGDREDFVKTVDDDSNRFVKRNSRKYPSVSLHLNNGVVFLDDEDDDLIYSIDKANVARRIAKGNYCVTSVVYSSEMMGRKEEDAKIMAMFDHAIKNGNIKTFFQPKMDIKGQKIIGAEVLSRIYDANGNMMMPDTYIPVLENSGKVVELDRYVMRETFSAIRNWIDRGWNVVPVSINLSRMNFYEDNIAEHIYTEFCKYNIPIEYIESLFEKKFPIIAQKIGTIVEGPYYKGVTEYKDSNVTIKIVAMCHEDDRFQVQRDLMRENRAILTEEGIDISYPQIVINQPEPKKDITITKKTKKNVEEFIDEQRDLSSDLEEQQN